MKFTPLPDDAEFQKPDDVSERDWAMVFDALLRCYDCFNAGLFWGLLAGIALCLLYSRIL